MIQVNEAQDPKRIVFDGSNFLICYIEDLLPKHRNWPSGAKDVKKPWNNEPAVVGSYICVPNRKITKLYIHQTAGSVSEEEIFAPLETTRFIINDPKWIFSKPEQNWSWSGTGRGWPGIPYTFYIPYFPAYQHGKAIIYQCNNLNWVTWHSGDNSDSISCVCQGYFKSRHIKTFKSFPHQTGEPSEIQQKILPTFIQEYAIQKLNIDPKHIKGHCDSPKPKPACPGDTIEVIYKSFSKKLTEDDLTINNYELENWHLRQAALVALNHNIGYTGKNKNGIDGSPKSLTRLAIEAQEESFGLKPDGYWDDTFDRLIKAILIQRKINREYLESLFK